MAGLDNETLGNEGEVEADKFIERYPTDYQNQPDFIAGLLISAEVSRKSIEKDDRSSIEKEMLRVLDHQSPTRLSEEGMRPLNLYAAGFKTIREEILPPQRLEDFLFSITTCGRALPNPHNQLSWQNDRRNEIADFNEKPDLLSEHLAWLIEELDQEFEKEDKEAELVVGKLNRSATSSLEGFAPSDAKQVFSF